MVGPELEAARREPADRQWALMRAHGFRESSRFRSWLPMVGPELEAAWREPADRQDVTPEQSRSTAGW